ncbi:MAG: polyketide cyclase [Vicinamibacterales bacterium]
MNLSPNHYHFVTVWRVPGTTGEVADVLRDPLDLVRWWPAVYLNAEQLQAPDERGLGQRVRLRTKGWLPYELNWDLTVVESRYPERFVLEASGDFVGRGIWTLVQDGGLVEARYEWQVQAGKPLLQMLGSIMRPVLEANHRWAMRQGEESLRLELLRRRAGSVEARRSVAPPPGPVTYAAVGILAGAAVVGGALGYLVLRQRRKARQRRDRQA